MSPFAIKPYAEVPTSLNFPTPLLLGMEFSKKQVTVDNELDELVRIHEQNEWVFDLKCTEKYLQGRTKAIILTDTYQNITWTSRGFVRMTGYTYCEAFNRKPTFLQGPKTLDKTRLKISETLQAGKVFEGNIVNYRKTGMLYTCRVTIIPIHDTQNKLVNYIALEEEK